MRLAKVRFVADKVPFRRPPSYVSTAAEVHFVACICTLCPPPVYYFLIFHFKIIFPSYHRRLNPRCTKGWTVGGWTAPSSYHPPILQFNVLSPLANRFEVYRRFMVGWPPPSYHAQSPYTSTFQTPMVRWEDDLQIPLEKRSKKYTTALIPLCTF